MFCIIDELYADIIGCEYLCIPDEKEVSKFWLFVEPRIDVDEFFNILRTKRKSDNKIFNLSLDGVYYGEYNLLFIDNYDSYIYLELVDVKTRNIQKISINKIVELENKIDELSNKLDFLNFKLDEIIKFMGGGVNEFFQTNK